MNVRMNTLYASPTRVAQPGETLEVSDAEGQALVAGHYAVAVVSPAVPKDAPPAPESIPEPAGKAAENIPIRRRKAGPRMELKD